jgi:hypothetical protein
MLYVRCQDMLYVTFTEVPVVAACGGRATHGWEGKYPKDREQTHQLAHADQAVSPSDDLLFQDGTHARLGDWPLYQSI